jgi:hypothetical protein
MSLQDLRLPRLAQKIEGKTPVVATKKVKKVVGKSKKSAKSK